MKVLKSRQQEGPCRLAILAHAKAVRTALVVMLASMVESSNSLKSSRQLTIDI